jgi:hypothetical protein
LSPNRRFKLNKRSQLFIRAHNEALSFAAMCIRFKKNAASTLLRPSLAKLGMDTDN